MDQDQPIPLDTPFSVPNEPGWHRGEGNAVLDAEGSPAAWFWHGDTGYWILRSSYLKPAISTNDGEDYQPQDDHAFIVHVGWQGQLTENYDVPILAAFLYLVATDKDGWIDPDWEALQFWDYLTPGEVISIVHCHEEDLAKIGISDEEIEKFFTSELDES